MRQQLIRSKRGPLVIVVAKKLLRFLLGTFKIKNGRERCNCVRRWRRARWLLPGIEGAPFSLPRDPPGERNIIPRGRLGADPPGTTAQIIGQPERQLLSRKPVETWRERAAGSRMDVK